MGMERKRGLPFVQLLHKYAMCELRNYISYRKGGNLLVEEPECTYFGMNTKDLPTYKQRNNLVNITEDKQGRTCKKMLQSKIFPNKVEIILHFILNSYVETLPLALKIF